MTEAEEENAVRQLCELIGYGTVRRITEALWNAKMSEVSASSSALRAMAKESSND